MFNLRFKIIERKYLKKKKNLLIKKTYNHKYTNSNLET